MKSVLVVHPGSIISTADVHAGLVAGLNAHGVAVVNYALHGRLKDSERFLRVSYLRAKKTDPTVKEPTFADVCYHSTLGIYERIVRFRPDAILIVSGVMLVPDTYHMLRRTGLPMGVILTESPYLMTLEKKIAALVDCVWTNEVSAVAELRTVQPNVFYLPHAWLPGVHNKPADAAPAHDVVFVGTGFPERIALLERVNWTGIDLGLYGNWTAVRAKSPLKRFVRGAFAKGKQIPIPNTQAAALYRHAKIGLNIYRTSTDMGGGHISHADSLNPRAYELSATGSFHLSTPRAEVTQRFGDLVPTFTTSADLTRLLRYWLAHEAERQAVAARLPALVAEDTWLARGGQVLGTIRTLQARAA
jgi:spore maturation protein CgeB